MRADSVRICTCCSREKCSRRPELHTASKLLSEKGRSARTSPRLRSGPGKPSSLKSDSEKDKQDSEKSRPAAFLPRSASIAESSPVPQPSSRNDQPGCISSSSARAQGVILSLLALCARSSTRVLATRIWPHWAPDRRLRNRGRKRLMRNVGKRTPLLHDQVGRETRQGSLR